MCGGGQALRGAVGSAVGAAGRGQVVVGKPPRAGLTSARGCDPVAAKVLLLTHCPPAGQPLPSRLPFEHQAWAQAVARPLGQVSGGFGAAPRPPPPQSRGPQPQALHTHWTQVLADWGFLRPLGPSVQWPVSRALPCSWDPDQGRGREAAGRGARWAPADSSPQSPVIGLRPPGSSYQEPHEPRGWERRGGGRGEGEPRAAESCRPGAPPCPCARPHPCSLSHPCGPSQWGCLGLQRDGGGLLPLQSSSQGRDGLRLVLPPAAARPHHPCPDTGSGFGYIGLNKLHN